MIYVTFRGIRTTLKSMRAVGDITATEENRILDFIEEPRQIYQPWRTLREEMITRFGQELVDNIEKDART